MSFVYSKRFAETSLRTALIGSLALAALIASARRGSDRPQAKLDGRRKRPPLVHQSGLAHHTLQVVPPPL